MMVRLKEIREKQRNECRRNEKDPDIEAVQRTNEGHGIPDAPFLHHNW
jgi:hypothetical protein